MRFPEGNTIVYFQDHDWHRGVPSEVDFEVDINQEGRLKLTAPGYGLIGNYGSGSLLLRFGNLEQLVLDCEKSLGEIAYDAIKEKIKEELLAALNAT